MHVEQKKITSRGTDVTFDGREWNCQVIDETKMDEKGD